MTPALAGVLAVLGTVLMVILACWEWADVAGPWEEMGRPDLHALHT